MFKRVEDINNSQTVIVITYNVLCFMMRVKHSKQDNYLDLNYIRTTLRIDQDNIND